jgi:hypothetical protein
VTAFGLAEQQVQFLGFLCVDVLNLFREGSRVDTEIFERLFEGFD